MELALAILSMLAAIGLGISAWRAHRSAQRLALEMIQLRDRLKAAESGYEDLSEQAQQDAGRMAGEAVGRLTERVKQLERELERARRAQLSGSNVVPGAGAPAGAGDASPHPLCMALAAEGYHGVTRLEEGPDGRSLVHMVKNGIPVKGWVRLDARGQLEIDSVSTARAFP